MAPKDKNLLETTHNAATYLKLGWTLLRKHQAYLEMSNLDSGNSNIIQFETGEHPSQFLGWDSNPLRFSFPCHKLMASDRKREFLYLIYIVWALGELNWPIYLMTFLFWPLGHMKAEQAQWWEPRIFPLHQGGCRPSNIGGGQDR